MKLVFAGTPEFARVALERLHAAGHEVLRVLCQPDRPAGRGLKLQASPVKQWALDAGLRVSQPRSLRLDGRYPEDAASAQRELQADAPEVMVVAAYGLILPQWVLDLPRWGCINIHASLLPRWRGAAPIHRAIEAGDRETGVTLMQMDAGLDTGAILLREALAIGPRVHTGALHDSLAELGARMTVQALERLAQGPLPAQPQPQEGVCYAHKIDKAEALIDWCLDAQVIDRRVRAFDPFPGALTQHGSDSIKVWQTEVLAQCATDAAPGTVLALGPDGVRVACGQGQLLLSVLQRAGGRRLPVAEFLRGNPLRVGDRLGAPETGA